MSEDLLYDRDNNITGTLVYSGDYSGIPISYGATVSFKSKNNSYETDDKYFNIIPMSANNLIVQFNFTHQNQPYILQKAIKDIEDSKGVTPLSFVFDTGLFQVNSGYALNYSYKQEHWGHGDLSTNIELTDYSPVLNWSGNNVLAENWTAYSESAVSYSEYDVVYSGINSMELNNFYYCTGDHVSSAINSPTGASSMWTQDFWFHPDEGLNTSVEFANTPLEWKNSMKSRIKTKSNAATLQKVRYNLSDRSQAEAYAILHFLDKKGGYRKFRTSLNTVYDAPKVMHADQWDVTIKHLDNYTISVELTEDPLGIIPTS